MEREPTGGDHAAEVGNFAEETAAESGYVTTDVAAAGLNVSPRTVRDYIRAGKLKAKPQGEGVERRWLVSMDSLHALRQSRRGFAVSPREGRQGTHGGEAAAEIATDLIATVQDLQYRLGRAEARVELTERAESSVREERDRLLVDLKSARQRADEERERAERLRSELSALSGRLESPKRDLGTNLSPRRRWQLLRGRWGSVFPLPSAPSTETGLVESPLSWWQYTLGIILTALATALYALSLEIDLPWLYTVYVSGAPLEEEDLLSLIRLAIPAGFGLIPGYRHYERYMEVDKDRPHKVGYLLFAISGIAFLIPAALYDSTGYVSLVLGCLGNGSVSFGMFWLGWRVGELGSFFGKLTEPDPNQPDGMSTYKATMLTVSVALLTFVVEGLISTLP